MESGLESVSCLWKSFYRSGQNLSVNLSDYINDVGSILFNTVQTELIENQLFMKILKSVLTTVFPFTEGIDIHLKTNVFRKTDHEYRVFAHPV